MSVRLNYSFTPNLTIEYWGQPFVSNGECNEFKYISDPLAKKFSDRYIAYDQGQVTQDESESYLVDENRDGPTDYPFSDPDFYFMQL